MPPTTTGAPSEKNCSLKLALSLCQRSAPVRASRRDEVVVRRLHVQPLAVEAQSLVGSMRAALRLPVVVPDNRAGVSVDGPGIVGRGGVQNSLRLQNRAAHADGRRGAEQTSGHHGLGYFTAHDGGRAGRPQTSALIRGRPARQARRPGQRHVLDVDGVDLREAAETPAGIIARIRRPRIFQRREVGGLRQHDCWQREEQHPRQLPATTAATGLQTADRVAINVISVSPGTP